MERDTRATYIVLGLLVLGICFVVAHLYLHRESYATLLRPVLKITGVASDSSPTAWEIETFISQFKEASKDSSLDKAEALNYWAGQTPQGREEVLANFNRDRKNMALDGISFLNREEAKETFLEQVLRRTESSVSFNGLVTGPNLPPVGYLIIPNFMPRPFLPKQGYIYPVGRTPSGKLKFISYPKTGTPYFTPQSKLPQIIMRMEPVSQHKADAFCRKFKSLFNSGDWRQFMTIYEMRETTQEEINLNAETYVRVQERPGLKHKRVGFEGFENGRSITTDDRTFNLPVYGYLYLTFEQDNPNEPIPDRLIVGMNEKGELKIPLLKPPIQR